MKRTKPGFKAFIKTRTRHPFNNNSDILYKDNSGTEYTDAGSVFTVTLSALYLLLFLVILLNLRLTVLGWIIWLTLPVLHRFVLRYFWTKFEVCENEFAPLKTDTPLIRKKPWERQSLLKKAFVFLAAALAIAIAAGAYLITDNPPFKVIGGVRFIRLSEGIETVGQQYEYARDIAAGQFTGAELLWYRIGVENDEVNCHFIFGNATPGIFIMSPKEMVYISFQSNSYLMWHYLWYDMAPKMKGLQRIDFVPAPGEYPEGTFYEKG